MILNSVVKPYEHFDTIFIHDGYEVVKSTINDKEYSFFCILVDTLGIRSGVRIHLNYYSYER